MSSPLQFRESQVPDAPLTVDRDRGIIHDVAFIGLNSRNNGGKRRYLREAVSKALPLYEGKVVNLDHHERSASNPDVPVEKRIGRLKNVRLPESEDRGRCDLHINPKHPFAEAIFWWAENDPSAIGLSHDASGKGRREDGWQVVEAITSVDSVDLVADPASVSGLKESLREQMDPTPEMAPMDSDSALGAFVMAIMKDPACTKAEKRAKIVKALDLMSDEAHADESPAELGDKPEDEAKAMESLRKYTGPSVKWAVRRLDAIAVREAFAARKADVSKRCVDAKLPKVAITETFVESLASVQDDNTVIRLIEDRRKLASGVAEPVSHERSPVGTTPPDVKAILLEKFSE